MAAEDKLLKLQQYQRTQQFIHDLNFEKATQLPMAAAAEGSSVSVGAQKSSSYILRRTQDSIYKSDMSMVRDHLKVMSEVDPANPYYANLLDRISHGENITWKEFENAVDRFSSNQYYLTKLQDEINNTRLASGGEEISEDVAGDTPSNIINFPVEEKAPESLPDEESPGQESPSGDQSQQLPTHQPPPRVVMAKNLTNKQIFGDKETYGKFKENMKASRDERAAQLWDQRRKSRMTGDEWARDKEANKDKRDERAKKLWDRRKSGLLKPKPTPISGGFNPLADWLGKKIAQSRFAQPALKALESLAERMGLNPVLNAFKALNNLLEWPERMLSRLAGQAGKAALDLGWNAGRSILSGIADGAAAAMEGLSGVGTTLSGWGTTAGAFLAGGGGALFVGILTVILGAFALFWLQQKDFEDCGKPGTMNVTKSAKEAATGVPQGGIIHFEIFINYKLNCGTAQADNVEVRDLLPPGTTYDESGTSASSVEIVDPFQNGATGIGDENTTNPLIPAPADNPNNVAATGLKPSQEGNTLVWKIGTIFPNRPITLNFAVKAPSSDTWVMNQATVKYTVNQSIGGFPPTKDNCNGTYQLNNPVGNFGDPSCDFKLDDLYNLLKQQDPRNADFWFLQVARCESSYNPNSWRDPNITPKTPDPAGAWGLYQMGRGRNGQYDHGDVDWRLQTSNAVTYAKSVPSIASYWACAR